MLKAIIVDDEEEVRNALQGLISFYHPEVKICALCGTVDEALTQIDEHDPGILFLDVEIGDELGFDILKKVQHSGFDVIFITAHHQYAVEAFRFSALDYLLKPVDPDLLAGAVRKASERADGNSLSLKINTFLHNMKHAGESKKIVLKTVDTVYLVNLCDIMYCVADRSYTTFYMSDNTRITVSNTMGDYEELFKGHGFFRIHQSYLINLRYFRHYEKKDGGRAVMKNNEALPVATRKKDTLIQLLSTL